MEITQWVEGLEPVAGMVIAGMPNEVYHASPGISKSGLDKITKSPAHFKRGEHKATRAMDIGTAAHCALLEPHRYAAEYVLLPDIADRRASEYKKASAAHGKDLVLVGAEPGNIAAMQAAVNWNPRAKLLLQSPGYNEISVFATDPESGILCRCRFDRLMIDEEGQFVGVDLKKTRDAEPAQFSRSIAQYRYHVQAAYYADVFEWATGHKLSRFWFVAIEDKAPNCLICRFVDDESTAIGRSDYRSDITLYTLCTELNQWPGYADPENDDDCSIGLPSWAIGEYENDLEIQTGDDE